ncbi:unnamed protein product [Clavelina lepadiformis]|uniref:Transmembrane protein 209 n=1 Tax=Clavelina lepadiformis TaxID=159417 RepID=A0ABP0H2T8_CLALP
MAYPPSRRAIEAGKVSPVVHSTANQKLNIVDSKKLLSWAVFNCLIAVLLFYEMNFRIIQCWLRVESNTVYFAILILAVIFIVSALVDFIQARNVAQSVKLMPLSPIQKKLMGIRKSDPNFVCDSSTSSQQKLKDMSPQKSFSLTNFTRPTSSTPISNRNPLDRNSPSPSPSSSFHTTLNSPSYQGNIPSYYPQGLCESSLLNKTSPLMHTLDGSSFLDSSGGGSPHLRSRRSPFINSPLSPDDFMTDQKTLNNYLKAHFEAVQTRMQLSGYDGSPAGSSYWGHLAMYQNEPTVDLAKNLYQLSARSPTSPTLSKDSKDDSAKLAAIEYWIKSGVDADCLTEWVARLRRWISLTVLRGIVKEIDKINANLKRLGCPEVQIGESSLHALKQIQQSKGTQLPSLTWIIQYLELTTHQEYLVERLRTLASGGYMSDFLWDKGGSVKGGRDWGDDLVTDCDLVMHMFCVYMDLHLPPHPRYPDGKTFTSQYFLKTPDKPKLINDAERKMMIYQSSLHPPHYQMITKESTLDLPPGRHNMFCTLLLFLHHIKTKESSMLSQVNLGLSGINILYVIEPTNRCKSK